MEKPTVIEAISALKTLLGLAVWPHLPPATTDDGARQLLATWAVAEMALRRLAEALGVDYEHVESMEFASEA